MELFTPLQYSKIAVANAFGLDKENWTDRLDWFHENQEDLPMMLKEAEEPAMFFAATNAYVDIVSGKPSGFPISLDATASGIQLLACMTSDRKSAEACNVVDVGRRMDAYTFAYEGMCARYGEKGRIERPDTKRAFMTSMYSSRKVPMEVFGEGELLNVFYDTIREEFPGPYELNEAFLALWNPKADEYRWVLPDNFHVVTKNMVSDTSVVHFRNKPYEVSVKVQGCSSEGRSLGANTTHSVDGLGVREIVARCMYDPLMIKHLKWVLEGNKDTHFVPKEGSEELVETLWGHYKDSGFLSARILSYLNQENLHIVDKERINELLDTLPNKPFQVITNHDCFRVLPSYGNDIRKQYNQFLHDITKSNILEFLLKQITGRHVPIKKLDPTLYKDILNSNYSLS